MVWYGNDLFDIIVFISKLYRYVCELTFLHLFLVPKSILVFCKIEQISNKTKILKTLLCRISLI